jgi:hypothetical protein
MAGKELRSFLARPVPCREGAGRAIALGLGQQAGLNRRRVGRRDPADRGDGRNGVGGSPPWEPVVRRRNRLRHTGSQSLGLARMFHTESGLARRSRQNSAATAR